MNGGATRAGDTVGKDGKSVVAARAKDQLRAASGEENRSRLTDSATRSRDGNHLAFNRHGPFCLHATKAPLLRPHVA